MRMMMRGFTLFLNGGGPRAARRREPGGEPAAAAATATPIQIYGAWHCSNDACTWGTVRTLTDFDANNHWLIDRGDGKPSVNLVVLSFVNPLKLLNGTTDGGDANGVPVGMTQTIVNYFTSHGIRVMLSIGGITYVGDWDTALSQNATLLASGPPRWPPSSASASRSTTRTAQARNLTGLQSFIGAYRAAHPYDAPAPTRPPG